MGPAGQTQLQLGRLSTTANQLALRLLSPLVPPYTRPNKPWYPMSNSTHTSGQATGHSSEVHSAPFTHSPHPWGSSRAVQAGEEGPKKLVDYTYVLSGPRRGSPSGGQAPGQLHAVPKDVRPDTMHLSRLMTLKTRLHLVL